MNLFEIIWADLLGQYSLSQLSNNPRWFKDIYLDSSQVKNITGADCVGRNPTDRGRNGTKISVICDDNIVPLSMTFYGSNEADSNTTLESFDAIKCKIRNDERGTNNLITDKGFISEPIKEVLASVRVHLLTPIKVNAQNHYMSQKDKDRLHKRHKIENIFCRMDKFKRIFNRMERKASHQLYWWRQL